MARFWRHFTGAVAAALALSAALFVAPAAAQDLFDRPVLAVDPGMHTASIWSLAVDPEGRFAVTGGADRTVRIWSAADGRLLRTIWIPVGPDPVGKIYAVAISPDGATIAAGGYTERLSGGSAIYLFDRESGALIQRIHGDVPQVVKFLAFSPDGRYLASTLGGQGGLRVFDRDKEWGEAFRDVYDGDSYGAAFAPDGRLATTSDGSEGTVRLYDPEFHLVAGPIKAPSGNLPHRIAFSPDGRLLAVGYLRLVAVDLLDGKTLDRVPGPSPTNLYPGPAGLSVVAWSRDGRTLFAAGSAGLYGQDFLFAWDQAGLGKERRLTYCDSSTAVGINPLPDGRILVASQQPCLGSMGPRGDAGWVVPSPLADFRGQINSFRVSADGKVVDFDFAGADPTRLRFDVRSLRLTDGASIDGLTFAPYREGLAIDGWISGLHPTLNGRKIPMEQYDMSRNLAIAHDGKRFFLGSSFALAAFDENGAGKWRRTTRSEVWAVNAGQDGRIVVAGYGDGAIRWSRADDGSEMLALQVLPDKKNWVLWSPEGFYEATEGAQDVLKWVVNHGPDKAATTLPVSAIPKLHRPDALPLILQELETARALGIADVAAARLSVQMATGSAKPPGAVLHVLAIGVDTFGDKAGGLKLDYAVDDARDVASALLASQKGRLYADVKLEVLRDETADGPTILDALDAMASAMQKGGSEQDVAVILFSSHGEIIKGRFYLIPYGFDVGSAGRMEKSAVSADEFGEKVKAIAEKGKVLLLLDACHSGVVGPGGATAEEDASVLRNAVNRDNVTVLTSSQKDELSEELPAWKHGAFTQAFLDALSGAGDPEGKGLISVNKLADAMDRDLSALTKGKQHLGERLNFSGDVFVVNR